MRCNYCGKQVIDINEIKYDKNGTPIHECGNRFRLHYKRNKPTRDLLYKDIDSLPKVD